MHRDAHHGHDCWGAENEDLRTAWRNSARAALAAVAKAAGVSPMIVQGCDSLADRSRGMPAIEQGWRNTAALLRTLAEAAP